MEWLNLFGLIFMAILMIPNIIFAFKHKESFKNNFNNKLIIAIEQIGRFGCFIFMIINIPGTWFGWFSDEAFAVYLIVNTSLTVIYCLSWIIFINKNNIFRAVILSVIPAVIFLFSGIMSRSILLIISSVLFAPSHILISCKNTEK